MESPSSDAEALRDQQTAQVRAAHRLFVAADEFGHLERRHQPIGQPAVRARRMGRELRVRRSIRRIRVHLLSHNSSRSSVTPNSVGTDYWVERIEPACAATRDRAQIDHACSGLDKRDSERATGFDPIVRTAKGRCMPWERCIDPPKIGSAPTRPFRAKSAQRPYWWFRPSVAQLDAVGLMPHSVSTARSLLVRRSLEWPQAVSSCLISAAIYNQPSRIAGASSRCSVSELARSSSTGPGVAVEGWRPIATNDDLKITRVGGPCQDH